MTDVTNEEILGRLERIEREEGVRVVFACESGSRAWGFASPDSDFDVRFIHVHPRDRYLSLEPVRDVIERPIDGDLDINGWDLRKALGLLRKSNAPLLEWLGSPIVYREEGVAAARLRALAAEHHSPFACAYHYLHMARGIFRDHLRGEDVWTKQYFYALRPLLAIRWIEEGRGVAPTEFARLVETLVPAGPLRAAVDELVERKNCGGEREVGPRMPLVSEFIESELRRHQDGPAVAKPPEAPLAALDAVFLEVLAEVTAPDRKGV